MFSAVAAQAANGAFQPGNEVATLHATSNSETWRIPGMSSVWKS
jgi:hypothetical protein